MNRLQYLLTKLAEESSELADIALKTSQFGPYNVGPNETETNREMVTNEFNDVLAVVEMLSDEFGLSICRSDLRIDGKKEKVNRFFKYSCSLGNCRE
jgi:NTP pyrophosphatase (non-canonical NTP hydrolase)